MDMQWIRFATLFGIAGLALHVSCGPASYEIVRPGNDGDSSGNPQKFGPDRGEDGDGPKGNNPAPTARVQVILDGKPTTRVPAGVKVKIRPSPDTLDPDDVGKSQCANPGIVAADYELEKIGQKQAQRKDGCEDLSVPHTFEKPGLVPIVMTVTSNDDETAKARMELRVTASEGPGAETEGGFRITAEPMVVKVKEPVSFRGFCETKGEHGIRWRYGDGAKGAGEKSTHGYSQTGPYRVEATCESQASGQSFDAYVTIVVVKKDAKTPGSPTPDGPDGPNPPPPETRPDEGEHPCGDEPGQGAPGQGTTQPGQGRNCEPSQGPDQG